MDNLDPISAAKQAWAETENKCFPVPVVDIANRLGIQVFSDEDYPTHHNGHIEMNKIGYAQIIVNGTHSAVRKRFTIAHEIAHFLMDKDYLDEHRIIDRNGNAADASYRKRESRANKFAAELLMPEENFVEQYIALNDIERVADYFGVSKIAAEIRAVNLGLLKSE